MKRGYSILTRRIWGIDVNVWLTFGVLLIIAISLLGYKIASDVPCTTFDVVVTDVAGSSSSSLFVKENITFKADVKGNFFWDFGDGFQERGAVVNHQFANSGRQMVTVIMNGKCTVYQTVVISKDTSNADTANIEFISGPTSGYIGKQLTFSLSGNYKPTSYEWHVVDSREKIQTGNMATYRFTTAGPVTIELMLDHGRHKSPPAKEVRIEIDPDKVPHTNVAIPRPPKHDNKPPGQQPGQATGPTGGAAVTPPVTPPKDAPNPCSIAPSLTDEQFRQKFEAVIAGKASAQDFAPYFPFNGLQTIVYANKDQETVESFCKKISKDRRYKIKSVTTRPNYKNCIIAIYVEYKKSLIHL